MNALPVITDITFDENPDRLKIMWPVNRNWFIVALYTVMVILWIVLLIGGIIFTVRMAFSGERFAFAFTVMALVFLYVLYRCGGTLWNQWQYFATDREILFINRKQLIVRRPVSLLGVTDAYDMAHVSPFYFSDKHTCPAFDYGFQHVYFGRDLSESSAQQLVQVLNGRFFPDLDDDDDDEV